MDPDANSQTPNESTTTTAPAAVAQQPTVRTYTEEEVAAIRLQERNAAAAAARREAEARLKPKAETPKAPDPIPAPAVEQDDYDTRAARRSAFDRTVGKVGLDEEQIALLEIAYKAERPTDPVEWVMRKAKAFGMASQTTTTTTTQPPPTQTTAPQVNVQPPQPAPSTSVPNSGSDDVTRWNERQWNAYFAQHGANPGNPYHWSNMKQHRELAQKFESAMATKLIITKK